MFNRLIKYFLENRLITIIILITFIADGLVTAPFNWDTGFLPRNPIPVDAIPDIGDNQQIVATEWMGRSPKDIEDQITYPLTTSLLGIPGVKTIRSTSMFGMSFMAGGWDPQELRTNLNNQIKQITSSGVIEEQGKLFSVFNDQFYKTIKTFGLMGKTVYYQFCPMAFDNTGANWLNETNAIRNPYFGDSMLTCGETKETLKY